VALVGFVYLVAGFANRQMVERVGALLHAPYGCRQATYDLRRLKRKGLIEKIPQAHRYRLTAWVAVWLCFSPRPMDGYSLPGLSALDPQLSVDIIERSNLNRGWRCFDRALEVFIQQQMLAA
jgi:hypothetical protein